MREALDTLDIAEMKNACANVFKSFLERANIDDLVCLVFLIGSQCLDSENIHCNSCLNAEKK